MLGFTYTADSEEPDCGDAITFVTVTNIVLKIVEQNTHGAVMKELKYLSRSMMELPALIG